MKVIRSSPFGSSTRTRVLLAHRLHHGPDRRVFAFIALGAVVLTCGTTPRHPTTPFDAPLGRPPLDGPLVVTGGFGEYRVGHFHAGFDFGTGGKVGQPVFAPLAGHVERIRTSGVGYGRSIYLRTLDGRLLQFGHLDAFTEPMASYISAIHDSTGQYEQDLWPEAARFPIELGQLIAWTGQSGAGGPHMHFEIRRGDMAYHPQRAGLEVRDDRTPDLVSLTLEPLDDRSYVEGSAGPVVRSLGALADTLRVIGRVRAIVGARDGTWGGVDRMVPWLTRMEWGDQWIECRMDSISWATDMSEGDCVYDAGRVIGDKGIVLWTSRGFRARFIRSSAPLAEEAGTIEVRRGDAPLTVRLEARDLAGHVARRTVVIRPGPGPDTTRTFRVKDPRKGDDRFVFAALPYGYVRVTYRGDRGGTRNVRIGVDSNTAVATPSSTGWAVVIAPPFRGHVQAEGEVSTGDRLRDVGSFVTAWIDETGRRTMGMPVDWTLPPSARFDSSAYLTIGEGGPAPARPPGASSELFNGTPLVRLGPESTPLRAPIQLTLAATGKAHAGLYRRDADGWTWLGEARSESRYNMESRRLGWFAEFQDTLGPRITLRTPPRKTSPGGSYNRWALEAGITEQGSGVNARSCWFVVDQRKVAAEWDPEADVLRWRPLGAPSKGTHRYDVIAEDRAGNRSTRSGTFVME